MLLARNNPFSPQDSLLFESSPEVVLFLSPLGRIMGANQRVYEWIRVKPKELVGKSIFDLAIMTPESRELVKKKFRLRLNQKEIDPYEIEVFDKSGKLVVGRVSGRLIEEKGQVLGVLIMIANVTQLEQEMQRRLFRALESEARYSSLFENMSSAVAICEVDEKENDFIVKNVNRAFLKIEKTTKKAVLGRSLLDILQLDLPNDLDRQIKKAWKTEIPQSFTVQIGNQHDQRFLKGTIYHLQTGELTVIYDDVTQSIFDQDALKKNEIKFRTTFDRANDSLFIMEGNKFLDCNKKTIEMFGLKNKDEIVGHTPIEFSPPTQPDGISSGRKARQYIHRAQSGHPQRFYWQHIKKNGETFDVEVSLNRFYLNEQLFLLASVRDVTEEYITKHKLAISERRFRSVVENAQAIVFAIDTEGKFVLSEGQKLSLLGLKPGQMVGASAYEVYKDYPTVILGIKTALEGETYREILFIQDIYFDIFYSPLKDEKTGEVLGVVGMAVDVTQSEKFKERLVELDKSKSEFISTASHQLRSPLVNIRWGLEILLTDKEVKANDSLRTQMESIYQSSLKVIDLVNNLLDTSRIYSNKLVNNPKKLDVVKGVREILDNFVGEAQKNDLAIIWNGPKEYEFKVDHNLFKAVLTNVISNAIKYNKKSGLVAIFFKERKHFVDLMVANTGKSIPKDEQSRIFERFFRGSNVTEEFEGTGLGLYISKSYMRFLGGEISFESGVRFGEKSLEGDKYLGTIFTISFPK